MPDIDVRFYPASLETTPGLDREQLCTRVRALIREHHARPPDDPHEGPAVESVVVRELTQPRAGGWRIEFGYERNRYPNSRYDKSEHAEGTLELAVDGSVRRSLLGPLRDNF
jgi:hypothetical protein